MNSESAKTVTCLQQTIFYVGNVETIVASAN
jgi:hypothetical protein